MTFRSNEKSASKKSAKQVLEETSSKNRSRSVDSRFKAVGSFVLNNQSLNNCENSYYDYCNNSSSNYYYNQTNDLAKTGTNMTNKSILKHNECQSNNSKKLRFYDDHSIKPKEKTFEKKLVDVQKSTPLIRKSYNQPAQSHQFQQPNTYQKTNKLILTTSNSNDNFKQQPIDIKSLEKKNELERLRLNEIMKKLEIDLMNAKLELMQDDCLKSYTLSLFNERSSEKTNYKQSFSCDSSTSGIVATTESSAVASSASSSASSVNGSPQIYSTFVNKLTTIHSQNNSQPNQTKTNASITSPINQNHTTLNNQENKQKKKRIKKNPLRRHTIAMSIAEFKPIHQLSEQIKSISKSNSKKRSKSNSKVAQEEKSRKTLSKSISNLPSLNKEKLIPNEDASCASNEIDESQVKSAILNLSPLSISTSSVSSVSSSSMSITNKQYNRKQAFNVATNLSNQVGSISNTVVSPITENRHESNTQNSINSIKHDKNLNNTIVQFNCTFESLI